MPLQPRRSHTVVRLPGNDGLLIQRLLDLGIDNLVIPMVESADDAKSAVAATRYPPNGVTAAPPPCIAAIASALTRSTSPRSPIASA